MEFDTNIPDTIDAFIGDYGSLYDSNEGVTLSRSGDYLYVTANVAGTPFTSSWDPNVSDLEMMITTTTPNVVGQARIDTITIHGTEAGTADILCDGVTREAVMASVDAPTSVWNTRGGSEADPLLEIIGGELGNQMSRHRQLLQLPIWDRDVNDTDPHIDVIGCIRDLINGDNSSWGINLIDDPDGSGQDYDTFTVSGISVLSAINLSGGANAFSSAFALGIGSVITVITTLTLNSGEAPIINLAESDTTDSSDQVSLVSGLNVVTLTATAADPGSYLRIRNTAPSNFSLTDIYVYYGKPRMFAFNRGVFNMKQRHWDIDMVEIVT